MTQFHLKQIPLDMKLDDFATFENYYFGRNEWIHQCLIEALEGKKDEAGEQNSLIQMSKKDKVLYLWGDEGVGKTHLLQACCHHASKLNQVALYLSLKNFTDYSPAILENLENLHCLCLDDVSSIAGNDHWEEILFYLYNRVCERSNTILIFSDNSPAPSLPLVMQDLKSRLVATLALPLLELNDDEKVFAIKLFAKSLGINLSQEVTQYLITHSPRSMQALITFIKKLDHASLSAKRKITIPFVKDCLR